MKNLLYWIKNKKRSLLYGIFMFAAFELLVKSLDEFGVPRFLLISSIMGVIMIGELFFGLMFLRKRYSRYEIPQVIWPLVRANITHQVILPILLYVGMVGFIFFYHPYAMIHILILIVSFCYWLLFMNIRSIYDHDFELRHLSHGIFNLIKIFVFFLLSDFVLEITHYFNMGSFLAGLAIFAVTLLLIIMALERYLQLSASTALTAMVFSLALGGFSWYLGGLVFTNYFNLALVFTTLYYVLSSMFNHKAEGSLTLTVVAEYLAVSLLSIIILFG